MNNRKIEPSIHSLPIALDVWKGGRLVGAALLHLVHFDDFSTCNYRGATKEAISKCIALKVLHSLISNVTQWSCTIKGMFLLIYYMVSSTSVPSASIKPYKPHDNGRCVGLGVNGHPSIFALDTFLGMYHASRPLSARIDSNSQL